MFAIDTQYYTDLLTEPDKRPNTGPPLSSARDRDLSWSFPITKPNNKLQVKIFHPDWALT